MYKRSQCSFVVDATLLRWEHQLGIKKNSERNFFTFYHIFFPLLHSCSMQFNHSFYLTWTLSEDMIFFPLCFQVMSGGGSPTEWHWRRISSFQATSSGPPNDAIWADTKKEKKMKVWKTFSSYRWVLVCKSESPNTYQPSVRSVYHQWTDHHLGHCTIHQLDTVRYPI